MEFKALLEPEELELLELELEELGLLELEELELLELELEELWLLELGEMGGVELPPSLGDVAALAPELFGLG